MAKLTKVTSKDRRPQRPKAPRWSPGAGDPAHRPAARGCATFYAQRTGGKRVGRLGGRRLVEPVPAGERRPGGVDDAAGGRPHACCGGSGVSKPIWNTEINYGLQTGGGDGERHLAQEAGGLRRADLRAQRRQRRQARVLVRLGPAEAREHRS